MDPIFVGRQPIVDRTQHVVAYELLFRENASAQHAVFANRTFACMHVIANTFATMGVQAVLGGCRAFVNVDREFLRSDMIEALPVERVVLEVLEDITVDAALVERCRALRDQGFTLALDDYVPKDSRESLLEVVDWVKVDLPGLSEADLGLLVRELKERHVRTLAEKVETRQQFDVCEGVGFDLFQGFFFARPVILEGPPVDTVRVTLLALLQQLHRDDDTARIVDTLKRNAALGINLLRLVNSVSFAKRVEIGSIEDAVHYLGRRQLTRWVAVLLYAGSQGAAVRGALLQTAAHRGKLMENLLTHAVEARDREPERAFLAGMLSLVDVLFSRPLAEVIGELELESSVRGALLGREGRLGRLLALVEGLEQADWTHLGATLDEFGLDLDDLRRSDDEAYAWLHEFVSG